MTLLSLAVKFTCSPFKSIFIFSKLMEQEIRGDDTSLNRPANNKIPVELSRRYDVFIKARLKV